MLGSANKAVFRDDIDAVYVATTHNFHYENIKRCLESGKHVLCEKAMVLTEKDARELFDFAKNKGPLYGSFWGFIGGLGINVYVFAPILGICGFFSGLFFEKSYLLAIMTAFLSTSGYSLYIDGFKSFSVLMPNFLIALSIFLFFDKFETLKREQTVDLNLNKIKNIEISSQVTDNRLLKLSDAFYSLSQVFYTYSEKSKIPALNDCIKIVNDACESVCEGCIKKDLCWGENNFDTNDSITKLSLILLKNGELTEKEQKLFDKENCVKFSRLIKKINSDYSQISAKLISENKTQVLANEYNSFSKLLKKTADNLNKELTYEPENEKKVKDILGKLNILYDSITVFGKRNIKIDVYGIKIELLKISSNDIKNEFSNEFKCKFEDPCFLMTENRVVMRIQKQRKYLLECAKATCAKNGETVNGDSSSFFENDNNFFYSLICDGMGSGKDAALTSRLSAIIIEKLMNSISTKSVALDLLNGFLINKREECFSTVDLFEIDLLTGEGAFIKAGAAASYVIRGKNIFKISSSTTPTGILYNVRAEQTKLELYPGDIIIMTSDGLSDEIDTPLWLSKLSFNEEIENVSVLAKKILSLAKEEKEKSDDMTVSVMKIKST